MTKLAICSRCGVPATTFSTDLKELLCKDCFQVEVLRELIIEAQIDQALMDQDHKHDEWR